MDEIKIVSEFLRGHISDILKSILLKHLGCDIDVRLNELTLTCNEGDTHVQLDLECEAFENDIDYIFNLLKGNEQNNGKKITPFLKNPIVRLLLENLLSAKPAKKLIGKSLEKSLGGNIKIKRDKLKITRENRRMHVHLELECAAEKEEVERIFKKMLTSD